MKQPYTERESLNQDFATHLSRGKLELYQQLGMDVIMGERQGIYLSDTYSERRWINCHCNGGVFNLGHRNPTVVDALRDALENLDIGNHHLISGYRTRLAKRLSASTNHQLPRVVFGVSGGEAIDLAIKLARAATGRNTILSVLGGYHGHTGLALAAGDAQYREPFGPNPAGFIQVPFNNLDALGNAMDDDCAAVLLEPVPATLGMPISDPGYMAAVQTLCQKRGAKLIMDEVQTGLGRTGEVWCYQHAGIAPDALVTGKGLSGGVYPITATLMTNEMHAVLDAHPFIHVSTFGGSELGCAVALSVLDIIEAPGFLAQVDARSEQFGNAFAGLPFELRRKGLMMGFKFPAEGAGMMAARLMYSAGVFAAWANNDPSVLQFLPPLIISDDETNELIDRVVKAFS